MGRQGFQQRGSGREFVVRVIAHESKKLQRVGFRAHERGSSLMPGCHVKHRTRISGRSVQMLMQSIWAALQQKVLGCTTPIKCKLLHLRSSYSNESAGRIAFTTRRQHGAGLLLQQEGGLPLQGAGLLLQ